MEASKQYYVNKLNNTQQKCLKSNMSFTWDNLITFAFLSFSKNRKKKTTDKYFFCSKIHIKFLKKDSIICLSLEVKEIAFLEDDDTFGKLMYDVWRKVLKNKDMKASNLEHLLKLDNKEHTNYESIAITILKKNSTISEEYSILSRIGNTINEHTRKNLVATNGRHQKNFKCEIIIELKAETKLIKHKQYPINQIYQDKVKRQVI
ncbi:hypothetical protein RFI_37603 [Reticulomyxa filosa]|uniref:Uncharacterized protein n=1 Tax=Reticulomyxa filosa TaxID=46433 RepID=X6LGP4_RETFI|nr:hypothetical protein RFI_37603 [Reticulomyxa filosa]|eukprot:ETN99864.1 hypothetical protein RFI_37603 [Reticulomyxa filosa]